MMHRNPLSVAMLAVCSAAHGQVFDLQADWSEAVNPNGPWSYAEGNNPLAQAIGWQNGCGGGWSIPQNGWADDECNNTRLPFFYKSNGSENFAGKDMLAGDIIVHTTDPSNGVGNGVARFVWSPPNDGIIDIAGSAWLARNIGRSNDWRLVFNGTVVSTGSLFDGDPYSRANPMDLALGSGGAGVLENVPVYVGKPVVLEVERSITSGEFTGLNLTITLSAGSCYGDCDQSMLLDFFDFLCFQNEFTSGTAYADCDGSGSLDFFDFLCFQNAFVSGCP